VGKKRQLIQQDVGEGFVWSVVLKLPIKNAQIVIN